MQLLQLKPASDLQQQPLERYRHYHRESGLVSTVARFCWWSMIKSSMHLLHRVEYRGRDRIPPEPPFVLVEAATVESVAVLGVGPVGQSCVALASLSGAGEIVAVDSVQDRLDFARRMAGDDTDETRDVAHSSGWFGACGDSPYHDDEAGSNDAKREASFASRGGAHIPRRGPDGGAGQGRAGSRGVSGGGGGAAAPRGESRMSRLRYGTVTRPNLSYRPLAFTMWT